MKGKLGVDIFIFEGYNLSKELGLSVLNEIKGNFGNS